MAELSFGVTVIMLQSQKNSTLPAQGGAASSEKRQEHQ